MWVCIDRVDVTTIGKRLFKGNSLITSIGDGCNLVEDLIAGDWTKKEHTRMHVQKVREYI